ncbi:hypothetical protein [Legionella gresilensis]|uniref:hypothetical protein n=1 Tax=Legionella gresilensis TaxID=91823 RepID=UPI001040E6BC|nr:hypothetical protein [Legionella gresilensis]
MPKVIIFADFDGTVTGRAGGGINGAVFSDFYRKLLNSDPNKYDYKNDPMKSQEDVQKAFEVKFGKYSKDINYNMPDADLLMTATAVEFFREMLKLDNVEINIVTRNRWDYIVNVFKYHGFTEQEIGKIRILDSYTKDYEVAMCLKKGGHKVFILDDSENDLKKMIEGTQKVGYSEEDVSYDVEYDKNKAYSAEKPIQAIQHQPGQFTWDIYEQEIKKVVNLSMQTDIMTVESSLTESYPKEMLSNYTGIQNGTDVEDKNFPKTMLDNHTDIKNGTDIEEKKYPKRMFSNRTAIQNGTDIEEKSEIVLN